MSAVLDAPPPEVLAANDVPGPVFTLGSALRWLGHDCPSPHRCSRSLHAAPASIWFLLPPPYASSSSSWPLGVRVLIEGLDDPAAAFDEIAWCAGRDGIEVGHRPRAGDIGLGHRLPPRFSIVTKLTRRWPLPREEWGEPTAAELAALAGSDVRW